MPDVFLTTTYLVPKEGDITMQICLINCTVFSEVFPLKGIERQSIIIHDDQRGHFCKRRRQGFVQPSSVESWTLALHIAVHRLCSVLVPFSATLAKDGLAECDQPGKNPLRYYAMAGNWIRATGRTGSEIHLFFHWAIITRTTGRTGSEIHLFSHWAIMSDLKDA